MYIPFDEMDDNSRVWVFQSNKMLDIQHLEFISAKMLTFCQNWKAHQAPLKTSFSIFFDRFVVLAVDESFQSLSGCSIDASVKILQEIENECGIMLFDRFQVAYKSNDMVVGCNLSCFKQMIKEGEISYDTLVFNNMVQTKKELKNAWTIPVRSSWHYQYVK